MPSNRYHPEKNGDIVKRALEAGIMDMSAFNEEARQLLKERETNPSRYADLLLKYILAFTGTIAQQQEAERIRRRDSARSQGQRRRWARERDEEE